MWFLKCDGKIIRFCRASKYLAYFFKTPYRLKALSSKAFIRMRYVKLRGVAVGRLLKATPGKGYTHSVQMQP